MKKGYVLLVDDEWEFAELTKKDVERIKADINGEFAEQYLIKLSNGETVDVGIIDDIKEAEEYYKNKMYEAMQILNDTIYDAERNRIEWNEAFNQMKQLLNNIKTAI